jgi:hypothetical protein
MVAFAPTLFTQIGGLMKTQYQKRLEAETRQEAYQRLTIREKLIRLQSRGHGHCKQAKRLERELGTVEKKS